MPPASRSRIALALAAVYLIWGSTYLAIAYAVETMPPLTMAGARFVFAGGLMFAVTAPRSLPRIEVRHWLGAFLVGGLMLFGGNGGVCWAEQRVESGIASLLIATVPLWAAVFDAMRPGGQRPTGAVVLGILVGLAGVALLAQPWKAGGIDRVGSLILLLAAASWAAGSVASKMVPLPESPLVATGMEMIGGGAILLVAGALAGEWPRVHPSQMSGASLAALAYLVVFGSIVGFTAFVWLLRVTTPAVATTYAYVNPVVAVLLGWAFRGEKLTASAMAAGALVVSAVALITRARSAPSRAPVSSTGPEST